MVVVRRKENAGSDAESRGEEKTKGGSSRVSVCASVTKPSTLVKLFQNLSRVLGGDVMYQQVPFLLTLSGLTRTRGLEKGVKAAPLGRGRGRPPEQLLCISGTVCGGVDWGEGEVENAVSKRHRWTRAEAEGAGGGTNDHEGHGRRRTEIHSFPFDLI